MNEMAFNFRHIRDILGGELDFLLNRQEKNVWGGPFNGQEGRLEIYKSIINIVMPRLILETGTYRGTTTEFMATSGPPVFTIEGNSRNYGFSRARLRRLRNVNVRLGDSRDQIRHILRRRHRAGIYGPVFAYLDAHWNADLPLAEEIDIIFNFAPDTVVMVDDFQVPDDSGYGYDDYGVGFALNHEYISKLTHKYQLSKLYPKKLSADETGSRRGCIILSGKEGWETRLLATNLLRTI
jgi:predicted O-methyltransferase YrrM